MLVCKNNIRELLSPNTHTFGYVKDEMLKTKIYDYSSKNKEHPILSQVVSDKFLGSTHF